MKIISIVALLNIFGSPLCFAFSIQQSPQFQEILPVLNPENLTSQEEQNLPEKVIENYIIATLNYFINPELGLDPETGLVSDHIRVYGNSYIQKVNYTSITNIGLQLASLAASYESGMLPEEKAKEMVAQIIQTLHKMEYYEVPFGKYGGCRYYFNYYSLNDLKSYRKFISSVDNAWLATGLIIARESFPDLAEDINTILSKMNFGFFYNLRRDLFRIGYFYNPETNSLIDYGEVYGLSYYNNLNSETRIISYLAIGKNDIPQNEIEQHLAKLNSLAEQKEYRGIRVVASVGGSAFEHGMPNIFVDEIGLSPLGLGINLKKVFYIQMLQAKEKGYPIWGESPCSDENNGYETFGSPAGIYPYESRGIITPHATFLALEAVPEKAVQNLEKIISLYPDAYSPLFGFADAIDVNTAQPIYKYLALDQGMIFLSGINFSHNGLVKQIFMNSEEGKRIAEIVKKIQFFNPDELREEIGRCTELINRYLNEGNSQIGEILLEYVQDLNQNYNLNVDF